MHKRQFAPQRSVHRLQQLLRQSAMILLTGLLTTVCATADDLDVYDTAIGKPKVLFVLDSSGSMKGVDDGTVPRIDRLKEALAELLANVEGADVGIMRFWGRGIELIHPIADVEEYQDSLQEAAARLWPQGGTPTVAALYEAQRYFTGKMPFRGDNDGSPYASPTSNQCEANHVVLLSDGTPSIDDEVVNVLAPSIGPCADTTVYDRWVNFGDADFGDLGKCGAELAEHLATTDQFPTITGSNNITTHSIGFNIRDPWLESLAIAGGGLYKNADSAAELLTAFETILNTASLPSTTAAPAVSVNAFRQNRHRNDLFYSLFQPSILPRWEGNIKKYQLVNGEVVDLNGNPVIQGGLLDPNSASLWSTDTSGLPVADGGSVEQGGAAARQPAGRRWFTDAGVSPDGRGQITPILINDTNQIAPQSFGAATTDERDRLVQWVRGFDSIDRNENGLTNEANHYIADSIHSGPVLVSYRAKESSGLLDEVLFTVNNMGVVHAIDPVNGNEIWSYSPAEMLPNVKAYVDNTGGAHVYGLDGSIVSDVTYKATTSLDFETEKVVLYLSQRRGGSNVFALDVSDALENRNPVKRLWTITGGIAGTDYRDLAQTWSTPRVVPIKFGCPDNCEVKNVVLFSGGYSAVYDDTDLSFPITPAATGHGNAIYMADPETGELIWSAGNGVHHALDLPMNDSVPEAPLPVDTDADGSVDILFYSDVAGNLWRIDLDQNADSPNDLALGGGQIAALNEPGKSLRFFNQPDVSINGTTHGAANFHISIGSGMRSSPTFPEPDINRLFVLRDSTVFSNPTAQDPGSGDLKPEYRYVTDSRGNRSVITPSDLWEYSDTATDSPTEFGYYREFDANEKILQPTLTHGGRIFLTTYNPPDPTARVDHCDYNIGESRLYILDAYNADNELSAQFGPTFAVVGAGIAPGGTIVDTGDGSGADFLIGARAEKLVDLLAPENPNVFRRFHRTGWSELDD